MDICDSKIENSCIKYKPLTPTPLRVRRLYQCWLYNSSTDVITSSAFCPGSQHV